MRSQLSVIHGLAFVEGDFDKSVSGSDVIFVNDLSGAASLVNLQLGASFRIILPQGARDSCRTEDRSGLECSAM